MTDFEEWLHREAELIRAIVRDDLPDWPWAFGFALGPGVPPWDEELNPA
jgi:hypothetical protein